MTNYSGFPIAQADQSGSFFDDQKIGLDIKYDQKTQQWATNFGCAIYLQYEPNAQWTTYISADNPTAPFLQGYRYDLYIPFEGDKWIIPSMR